MLIDTYSFDFKIYEHLIIHNPVIRLPTPALIRSIWPIDGTLTGISTQSKSGPESNCQERVLHIPKISRTRTSPSDEVLCDAQGAFFMRGVLLLCRKYIQCILSPTNRADKKTEILNED